MAVFMDTGGGDIYAAETKEECIEAMRKDSAGDYELSEAFEVDGTTLMTTENEDGSTGPLATLESEYTNMGFGYCICSENC